MDDTHDPDWYFEHVLKYARPWDEADPRSPTREWQKWWSSRPVRSDVARAARTSGWVISTSGAMALGMSTNDIRRERRRGTLWSPTRGIISPIDVRDTDKWVVERRVHAIRSAASALVNADHMVDGRSGAILHGLPTRRVPSIPELTGPRTSGRRGGMLSHAMRLRPVDTTSWFGVPVTTVARTLVDLGRRDADDAIMAADAALRAGLTTTTGIQNALDACAGWPGIIRAREVLALASPKAESPLESVTRLRLHDDGFPPPELQVVIGDYRVDLCWPALFLILECDGRGKYLGDASWTEKRRERTIRRIDSRWTVERVIWDDIDADWPQTAADLRHFFTPGAVIARSRR